MFRENSEAWGPLCESGTKRKSKRDGELITTQGSALNELATAEVFTFYNGFYLGDVTF